jgi:hypothetical protein
MQLKHTVIPLRFLQQLPEGIKYIHRHGKEFLVVEQLYCPKHHSLIADSVHIHGEPSVMLRVRNGDQEGFLFVDAFWGSHAKLFSFIPQAATEHPFVEAFCPTCGASLVVREACPLPDCDNDRSILFHLPGRGDNEPNCILTLLVFKFILLKDNDGKFSNLRAEALFES